MLHIKLLVHSDYYHCSRVIAVTVGKVSEFQGPSRNRWRNLRGGLHSLKAHPPRQREKRVRLPERGHIENSNRKLKMTRNPFGQHGLANTLESTDLPGLKIVDSFQLGGFPSLQSLKANAAADLNE